MEEARFSDGGHQVGRDTAADRDIARFKHSQMARASFISQFGRRLPEFPLCFGQRFEVSILQPYFLAKHLDLNPWPTLRVSLHAPRILRFAHVRVIHRDVPGYVQACFAPESLKKKTSLSNFFSFKSQT